MGIKSFFKEAWKEIKVIKGDAAKNKLYTSQRIYFKDEEARRGFEKARQKLFHVNKWSELPGISSAFTVYTAEGNKKSSGIPEEGEFLYIDLPGPTPETWVKVIDITEEKNLAEFTVSPSPDPREKNEEVRDVEHFFADEATSTFRVELKGNTLYACEIGKEEGINNKGKKAGGRELVNTVIAVGGWLAFQEMQWNKLTDYLVHHIETERKQK